MGTATTHIKQPRPWGTAPKQLFPFAMALCTQVFCAALPAELLSTQDSLCQVRLAASNDPRIPWLARAYDQLRVLWTTSLGHSINHMTTSSHPFLLHSTSMTMQQRGIIYCHLGFVMSWATQHFSSRRVTGCYFPSAW